MTTLAWSPFLQSIAWAQLRAVYDRPPSMFETAGPEASRLASLAWLLIAVGTAAFLVVMALLGAGLWRRRGMPNDDAPPPEVNDRRWVLVGGGLIPAVVLAVVFFITLGAHRASASRLPTNGATAPLLIEVIGHQWWWEVHYPSLGIVSADEIHIPTGRPVHVALRSGDVIHSFWIPNIAGKTDVIPGVHNEATIQADSAGRWRGECAEYCGVQHAHMALSVVAHNAGDFQQWVQREQAAAPSPTDSGSVTGERVFLTAGCAFCHTIRGTQAGGMTAPDLTHLASRLTLAGGMLPNTRGNLGGWIENPQHLKPGTRMPAVPLDGSSLQALLAYLESLR